MARPDRRAKQRAGKYTPAKKVQVSVGNYAAIGLRRLRRLQLRAAARSGNVRR
jgi:hypothetical protein